MEIMIYRGCVDITSVTIKKYYSGFVGQKRPQKQQHINGLLGNVSASLHNFQVPDLYKIFIKIHKHKYLRYIRNFLNTLFDNFNSFCKKLFQN